MIKIKDLKKWPKDWDQHIIQSCQLYFDNKTINFINYIDSYFSITFLPCAAQPCQNDTITQVFKLNLEFEYKGKEYIIYLTYKNPCFSINCFYKDYDVEKYLTPFPSINSSIMGHFSGYDDFGTYVIKPIAIQSSLAETSYEIIKAIESMILNHNNNDRDDDNNDNGDEPISPKSPVEGLKITT